MKRYDLHVHSTHSDGLLDPDALARAARAAGLAGLALTDHDTVAGLPDMGRACREHGLELVPGVEISADYGPGTLHIVGLFVDLTDHGLAQRLERLQLGRARRNPLMAERLAAAGVPITLEEVQAEAHGGQVGRPHFAAVLIRKGFARGMDDAFDRWLAKGRPGYVDKEKFGPEESVAMIKAAGGVAVMAHPVQTGLDTAGLEALAARLKDAGLDALEAWHSDHDAEMAARYAALAGRLGLAVSGGSDFHGFADRAVRLGEPNVDEDALAALRRRAHRL